MIQARPARQQQVDYRYAPQWHQSCICLPDDTHKTIVGPLGQLLYDYGSKRELYSSIEDGFGFGTVVQFFTDENVKIDNQRLHSARVPFVITESSLDGLRITQEAFAVGLPFIRDNTPTNQGNREDFILTTITNATSRAQTLCPVLVVDSRHKVEVCGRVALVDGEARVITSVPPLRVRQNLGDFKTLLELESVAIAPGETKQLLVLCDNAAPSELAQQFAENPTPVLSRIPAIRAEMLNYWENKTPVPYGLLSVPDEEIQNLVDASLRGIWQAREIKDNRIIFQVGPTRYRGLWVIDGAFILETATMFNRGLDARDSITRTLSFQKENGKIEVLRPNFYKENGAVLWTCARHAWLTQDKDWLRSVWPQLRKIVAYIKELRVASLKDDTPLNDGLMPSGFIDGGLWGGEDQPEYTNVYWNLFGLKAIVQAANWLGEKTDFADWQKEYDDFFATFQKAAARDMATDSFGNQYLSIMMDPKHRSLPQRAQWAFCQAVYPGQIFDNNDPVAISTMNMLHTTLQEGMVMGTGWHIDGIWNYFASFYAHACLWLGEPHRAAAALYAFANHASPLYAWREEHPSRDWQPFPFVGDMPHNWASAEFLRLTVHLLALDRGNELHLLEGIPVEWLQPNMATSLKNISTPFGQLTFILQVDATGQTATLDIAALPEPTCAAIYVHLGNWGLHNKTNLSKLDPHQQHRLRIQLLPSLLSE